MNLDEYRQPLAAVLGYLRSEGYTSKDIREMVSVHAAERVPVDDQAAFIRLTLETSEPAPADPE